MMMSNRIVTTIIHQAVTSKGNTAKRADVVMQVLKMTPAAASIKNGYGSLPLHVVTQRNTKMDSKTKERLVYALIDAYPGALSEPGGVGKRTPLHVAFTDYVSPRLTQALVDHPSGHGRQACYLKDKKGYLPAHVACSRHCSPEKLRMLLDAYPESLFAETNEGHTLLSLAKSTATKTHPNFALVDMLKRELARRGHGGTEGIATTGTATRSAEGSVISPAVSLDLTSPLGRSGSEDSFVANKHYATAHIAHTAPAFPHPGHGSGQPTQFLPRYNGVPAAYHHYQPEQPRSSNVLASFGMASTGDAVVSGRKNKRKQREESDEYDYDHYHHHHTNYGYDCNGPNPASLLLHLSHGGTVEQLQDQEAAATAESVADEVVARIEEV